MNTRQLADESLALERERGSFQTALLALGRLEGEAFQKGAKQLHEQAARANKQFSPICKALGQGFAIDAESLVLLEMSRGPAAVG